MYTLIIPLYGLFGILYLFQPLSKCLWVVPGRVHRVMAVSTAVQDAPSAQTDGWVQDQDHVNLRIHQEGE